MTKRRTQLKQQLQSLPEPWPWPLNLMAYDRNPLLSHDELTELDRVLLPNGQMHERSKRILDRLVRPIGDVLAYMRMGYSTANGTQRLLFALMQSRRIAFWGWTNEDWLDIICPTPEEFSHKHGYTGKRDCHPRPVLPAIVYLLCPHIHIDPLIPKEVIPLARKVFGKEALETALERLLTVLRGWGYRQNESRNLITCVSYLLIKNRSPLLEHLAIELLEEAQGSAISKVASYAFQVSRGLAGLGVIRSPLPGPSAPRERSINDDDSLSKEWISWCERWRSHSLYQRKQGDFYALLKVGRWLKVHHPEVTSPTQWSYELAIEFVAAVNNMKVGEWANPSLRGSKIPPARLGQPLRPHAKSRLIASIRTFFRDCQEWEWIPRQFNPARAFRIPKSLRSLLAPDPRVIDKDMWAKILWAAMNLQVEDMPVSGNGNDLPPYPIELVRAVAVVWCFAALRSDEIRRLPLGCIRWQHEDVMVPETGEILPRDAVCYLTVPVNKTSMAYAKPVHPLVGKRINEWEEMRPRQQPRAVDHKTGEAVQFLFSYRGTCVSPYYINDRLIPILCHKAGIPEQDSRGQITSHRARATIASMLYNAKEPLDIFQLKEYLGHKSITSTQSYTKVDPNKLATKVAKAGYLEQNMATIEVLLDQAAVMNGAAARGEVWKYYDLGHGYCTNTFWAECKHRMACARCPFYRPKQSTMEQLVEGKANLVRMLEFVKLTQDERLLVTEGVDLHRALIDRLADVPTPAGPTPRELAASQPGETKVIPLKSVRRSNMQKQDEQ